jgi:uncharacterized DUF497 family protein
MRFEWDESNILHIARHDVTPDEVESVFYGPYLEIGSYTRNEELRHAIAGMTDEGRVLFVVYTQSALAVRVVTAHESRKYRSYF